ncbi:hypothetical protein GGI22_002112 [Coemansia erecta]|nr:hypothetical protein GGI22_002112 [Coemansia erecta]
MAVMPLSAVATNNDADPDTFPIGIAIDYTSKKDLPPVTDDGKRVSPAPILWILNTDGCLLAYHIYNVFEMTNGRQCPDMVANVKQLPESTSGGGGGGQPFPAPTLSLNASATTKLPAFASKPSSESGPSAFGKSNVSGFGFGKASQPSSMAQGPTASGVSGQPLFGGGAKFGGSSGFGGFGQAAGGAAPPGGGQSIFDAPGNAPSIFGAPSGTTKDSSSNVFKPYAPVAKAADNVPTSVGFGSAFGPRAEKPATTASEQPKPSAFGGTGGFGSFGKDLEESPLSAPDNRASKEPKPAASGFGGSFGFGGFGKSLEKSASATSFGGNEKPASGGFGGFGGSSGSGGFGSALKRPTSSHKPDVGFAANALQQKQQQEQASNERQKREEAELRKEQEKQEAVQRELREEQEKQEAVQRELREEQEKQEAMQRELEMKTGEVLRKQYILTCNRFDRELHAFGSSLRKTETAISQVRSSRLPPIAIDPSVEQLVSMTRRMDEMSIDDTNAWNTVADCLIEALQVSRDELKASQKLLSKQISEQLKMETKREEISRILETSMSTRATSSSTFDGGLNPIQRDYQRRLKRAFNMIGKRTKDVEQVVDMEAERLENKFSHLPPALRAPTTDSIQRTLSNVTHTLEQKNEELSKLAARIDAMDLGSNRASVSKASRKTKPKKRQSFATDLPSMESASKEAVHGNGPTTAAASLRTAASGLPWSPHNLPLNSPPLGRRNRGFGLRPEDLIASDTPATKEAGAGDNTLTKTNPLFPNAKVRELVPRSTKNLLRKGSVVIDDDNTSAVSGFSNAAAYSQARKQRAIVRDVLTRSNRSAAVLRTPESAVSRAFKFGSPSDPAVPKRTPMPNLERYVKAFGKMKIDEPESEYETEPEPEPEAELKLELVPSQDSPQLSFGLFKKSPALVPSSGMPQPMSLADEFKPLEAGGGLFGTSKTVGPTSFAATLQNPSRILFGVAHESPQFVGRPFSGGALQKPFEDEFNPLAPTGGIFGLRSDAQASTSTSSHGASTNDMKPATFGIAASKPSGKGATQEDLKAALGAGDVKPSPLSSDMWTCEVCELKNPQSAIKCTICDASRSGAKPTSPALEFGLFPPSSFKLRDDNAFGLNSSQSAASVGASASKPKDSTAKSTFGFNPLKQQLPKEGEWTCEVCELKNPQSAIKCTICDAARPGASPAQLPETASTGSGVSGGFKPSPGLSLGSLHLGPVKPADESSKKDNEPASSLFGGFKPSGGLSFGSALSQASKPVSASAVVDTASDTDHASEADWVSDRSSDYTDDENDAEHKEDSGAVSENKDAEVVSEQKTIEVASENEDSEPVPADEAPNVTLEKSEDESGSNSEGLQTYAEVVKASYSEDDEAGNGVQSLDSEEDQADTVKIDSSAGGDDVETHNADDADAGIENEATVPKEKEGVPDIDGDDKDIVANVDVYDVNGSANVAESKDDDDDVVRKDEESGSSRSSESGGKPEQGHESDGFVHVSQLESGHESKEDVNSPVIASQESSVGTDTRIVSELGQHLSGIATDQLVDIVFSMIEEDAKSKSILENAPVKGDEPSAPDTEMGKEESQQSEARTSDEFIVLSQTESIDNVEAASDSNPESGSKSGSAFGLDDIAKGIDAVTSNDGAASSDMESDLQSDGESSVYSTSPSKQPSQPVAPSQPDQSKASGSTSFFKSGRLGNFGAFGGKSLFSSGQASPSPTGSANGTKALPNAFASGLQKSTAVPAFGAKLDRPAFGVKSMSSYEANTRSSAGSKSSQGGFASMASISTGFSAHGSAGADPFAAFRKANSASPASTGLGAATDAPSIVSKSSREASLDVIVRPNSTTSKKGVAASSGLAYDPIRDIIDNEGFDDYRSTSDANDYESD